MKTFLEHLTESQKSYDFKVKIANCDPSEKMDKLEAALDAYGLASITKPKSLPIQESCVDFPSLKNCEQWLIEVTLNYPVNDQQLGAIIAERAGFPQNCVRVIPAHAPEELWRSGEGELREYKQGEAVLDKPYEDPPEGKAAGKAYASATPLLKELNSIKVKDLGGDADGKTLNDIPQGEKSPVGSQQNKLPVAKK